MKDFGSATLGSLGGIFFSLCVAVSCFGSLNVHIFTTARLIHVAGKESNFPSIFGQLHSKRLTPINALMLEGVLSSLFVMVGNFSGLIVLNGLIVWTWYFVSGPWLVVQG